MIKPGFFQGIPKFGPDNPGQRFSVQKEIRFTVLSPVFYDSTAWNQEMDVGMIDQHFGPGLQNAHEPDIRAKEPFIESQHHDRFRGSLEEKR
jgi:hypothetical protein